MFKDKTTTFSIANYSCNNLGGKLYYPKTNNNTIYKIAKQQMRFNYGAWIGHDVLTKNELNGTNDEECCVMMQLNNGQRHNENCKNKHGFICKSEKKLDTVIQFRYEKHEFVMVKKESVSIIIDRLYANINEVTIKWEVFNQMEICHGIVLKCHGTNIFKAGESSTKLEIPISNDKHSFGKSFEIKLILPKKAGDTVILGNLNKTLVKIINGNGILQFEKLTYIGSETCGSVILSIGRLYGCEGEISVKWKTIGYTDQSGNLIFKHGETKKSITIDIIDDEVANVNQEFEVALIEANGGSMIGGVDKTKVIIEDNDGKLIFIPIFE